MALPVAAATLLVRAGRRGVQAAAAVVLAFLVLPILVVVPLSFTSGTLLTYPLPGVSLRWYEDFLTNPLWLGATRNSLMLALAVTALATVLGTMAAMGLSRAEFRAKRLVTAALITPLVVPFIVVAVACFFFYARFGLAQTFWGLVLAHTALALPFVVITVTATLQGLDPNLPRAASASGASPLQAFFRVVLPLILPGVFAGMLFAFVTSFDEVVVAIFLGSPELRTLPRQIWSGVRESITPTVTAAAVVLVLVSVLIMIVVEILRRRSERLRGIDPIRDRA